MKEQIKSNNDIYNGVEDYQRERKAYEKNVIKPDDFATTEVSAINNLFNIKTYRNFDL